MDWNSAEFDYWYCELRPEEKKRVWDSLRAEQIKAYEEWISFGKFARVAPLDIDLRTIENRKPPEPDILCRIGRDYHYFELGEVTDEQRAQKSGIAAKQSQDTFAGRYSQLMPLCRIFDRKCCKKYATNGLPVHLLLHYAVGHQVPHADLVKAEVTLSRPAIVTKLHRSAFSTVWLFDGWDKRVIDYVLR